MQFEVLYQNLVQGAEIIRALVTEITQVDASFKPNPQVVVSPRSHVPPL